MRLLRAALFALLFALPSASFAQTLGTQEDSSAAFTMAATPAHPPPFSTATLTFLSSTLDLANATLHVFVGGKEVYAGSVRPVPVTLGRAGSITRVSADISVNGGVYTQELSIQPQDVVIILEPAAYTPALYPGKPRIPLEGSVRAVAMATIRNEGGATLSPASLSYAWTVDDTRVPNSSGIGKSSIIVASPEQYRSREVSVTVTSADGRLSGGTSAFITPEDPVMRIYENDPLLGVIFERTVPGSMSITNETSLFAAPFSLPLFSLQPRIEWFLNGALAQTGSTITLRSAGSGAGVATLSAVAGAASYVKATETLSLSFGSAPANFFGL